jgi:hypothetical protein
MQWSGWAAEGERDFDFLLGSWRVRNRRLRERHVGSDEWEEFEASTVVRPLPGGLGNEDDFRTTHAGGFVAMALRLFDPAQGRWAIYWADSRRPGVLDPPVLGRFEGDVGLFEGTDVDDGRPVAVRFRWTDVQTPEPRWEQSFSVDGGRTWEPNWEMRLSRA